MLTIDPRDLTVAERKTALLAYGQRWTDLLLDLNTGPRPIVSHVADVTSLATAAACFAHPLLTLDRVSTLMCALNTCLSKYDTYTLFGTWDDEDDDTLASRTDDERRAFLQAEVDWYTFCLLFGAEPCVDCTDRADLLTWQVGSQQWRRCDTHAAEWQASRAALRAAMASS